MLTASLSFGQSSLRRQTECKVVIEDTAALMIIDSVSL